MSGDALFKAVRALRDSTEEEPARPEETRARVLSSLRKRRSMRLLLIKTLVPLAAVLVGSLAWAAPGRLPALWRAVVMLLGASGRASEVDSSGPFGAAPRAPRAPRASRPLDVVTGAPESTVSMPGVNTSIAPPIAGAGAPVSEAEAKTRAAPAPRASAQFHAPVAPVAPSASNRTARTAPSASAAPDGHALYKQAHQLHFIEQNPGAALRAWDDYLRADPRGRFSVEAHYNRALCLVRLGRSAEARPALDAFSRGAFGGYRKDEARALLDALGDVPR